MFNQRSADKSSHRGNASAEEPRESRLALARTWFQHPELSSRLAWIFQALLFGEPANSRKRAPCVRAVGLLGAIESRRVHPKADCFDPNDHATIAAHQSDRTTCRSQRTSVALVQTPARDRRAQRGHAPRDVSAGRPGSSPCSPERTPSYACNAKVAVPLAEESLRLRRRLRHCALREKREAGGLGCAITDDFRRRRRLAINRNENSTEAIS